MGLLSGGGASILTSIFANVYVSGTVYAVTTTYSEVGEPVSTETAIPARVQVDSMTEDMRASEGAADQDRRMLVLATDGVTVDTDSIIEVNEGPYSGSRWLVMTIPERDPCGAYWATRARPKPS